MILAPTNTAKDRGGNGRYKPLRKRKQSSEEEVQEFVYLDKVDFRMRFNNSKDPIYFVFDCIERKSLVQLAGDFFKDSLYEISYFVSRVAK